MFTAEITAGNIGTMICILGGWGYFVMTMKGEIKLLTQALSGVDRRLTAVENSISNTSNTLVQVAKQEVYIDSLSQRIRDLELERTRP